MLPARFNPPSNGTAYCRALLRRPNLVVLALLFGLAAGSIQARAEDAPTPPAGPDPLQAALADVAATTAPDTGAETVTRGGKAGKKAAGGGQGTSQQAASKSPPVQDMSKPPPSPDSPEDPTFQEALHKNFPLSPAQIRTFNKQAEATAKATVDRPVPHASTQSIMVSMDPGRAPARVVLTDGYATALSVLDETGRPWPIIQATIGEKAMYTVELPDQPGNVMLIWSKVAFAHSNLIVLLEGANVPITLALDSGRDVSYYNANLMVDRIGPQGSPVSVTPPPAPVADRDMRAILDGAGAATPGVRQVEVVGGNAEGFSARGRFFLRTAMAVLSPAYISVVRSSTISVYELPPSPLIEASDANGNIVQLTPSDATIVDGALAHKQIYDPLASRGNSP